MIDSIRVRDGSLGEISQLIPEYNNTLEKISTYSRVVDATWPMVGKTDPPKVFSLALIEDPIRKDKWCLTVQNARLIPLPSNFSIRAV